MTNDSDTRLINTEVKHAEAVTNAAVQSTMRA